MLCRNVRSVACLFVGALALTCVAQPVQAEIEFGIPTPIIGPEDDPINGVNANVHGWLSPDELTLHFASTRPTSDGGLADIWVSTRESTSTDWLTRENLGAPVNSGVVDYMPSFTADQKEIYYSRTTDPFGAGDAEIWVAQRPSADAAWNAPVKLSITEPGDIFPVISPNGLDLYFTSVSRDTDESPTIGNIWVASRTPTSETFGEPEFVQSGWGNTLSTDGLTFAFYGNIETFPFYDVPTVGGQDVLLRSRDVPDGDFSPVFNPRAPLNSSWDDYITQFTPSGDYVLLSSFRPGVPSGGILGDFGLWQVPIAESVPVDIKPGSDVAPINLKSKGKLPVAILSTDNFNALDIDVATLVFGDPLLIADGGNSVTPTSPLRSGQEDVNNDGLVDLTLTFSTQELVDNGVLGPLTTEGYLTGTLLDGTVVAGRDWVRIVPAVKSIPEPSSLLLVFVGMLAVTIRRRA